ncbi:MAG: BatD family protein [Bacteroidota bacterium]
MKHLLHYLLFVIFLSAGAFAQNGSFTASVDNDHVAVGDQFQLTFTFTGSQGGSNFRPPSFNDFYPLSGPNQSTNMQILNGAISSSISYAYILQAKTEGKFTIGSASIDYGGKRYQTQPISIVVSKGAPKPKQNAPNSDNSDIGKQIGDNLYLKAVVDKTNIYQGEQITVTYKIYTRVSVVNYNVTKLPSLTGFWSEDLSVPKEIQLTNETINGKQYRVGVLKKVALFPQRSGTLQIDPMDVECVVQMQSRRRSNDIFDQFFNDPFFGNVQNYKYVAHSQPVKITVNPLPSANVPEGFNGAVGKFSMEAWLDKRETKTNDPVTLKVKITGQGNLKLIESPAITVPPDLERYDPKVSDNFSNEGNRISGSRTFEYLLIPRHPGDLTIASFPFTFFDLDKHSYVTLRSPEYSLKVERGNDLAISASSGLSKEDVKLLGEDIRFIKSGNSSIRKSGSRLAGSPEFYVLTISPFFIFFGFVFYMRRREKFLGDVRLVRNRKARKIAQRRLEESKKFLHAQKKEDFYASISKALWGYASDKLGIPAAELTLEHIQLKLQQRGISAELVSKLGTTIEQCDFARFAPSQDSQKMDEIYSETVNLISSIEEQIR